LSLLEEALEAPQCVISVMGAHAGEDVGVIFGRKLADCEAIGRTFWVAKSAKARPRQVQELCSSGRGHVIFVEPASPGGARPTIEADAATRYSPDRTSWYPLPEGLGPVTGQIDTSAAAFVFDKLAVEVDGVIDLWAYADRSDRSQPLRFKLGLSSMCAAREVMSLHPARMKSRYRAVVAVAQLAHPYCVWLR
jgi:hypothetical protein